MGNSPRIAFKSSGRYRVSTFKIFQIIFLGPKIEILLNTVAIQDMIFWSENSKIFFSLKMGSFFGVSCEENALSSLPKAVCAT